MDVPSKPLDQMTRTELERVLARIDAEHTAGTVDCIGHTDFDRLAVMARLDALASTSTGVVAD